MTVRTSFLAELKRRNVIRVAIAYVAVSWLVLQAAALLVDTLELPNAISKGMFVFLVVGFIPAMVFSWVYELTPEGLKRESEIERDESITHLTGRRLDYLVIGVLVAVVALLLVDKFVLAPRKAARVVASQPVAAPHPAATQARASQPAAPQPSAAVVPDKLSIAVLPFVNMSSDKEQEFFSDGISEELLNLLAKIPQLQVTARTSSFSFKGKEIGIREIAKTLGVAHILEGSVRKSGDQVRITAQLINAGTDKHLWSQTYDRKFDDVFAIQDEIAADVVKSLEVTLLGAAPKVRTTDPEAYAMYLQAVNVGRLSTTEGFVQSDKLLKQVLELDPNYAPAWDNLGRNALNEQGAALIGFEEARTRATEYVKRALAIDPDYAPAHARLGTMAMYYELDFERAVSHYQRALALAPADTTVLSSVSTALQNMGRGEQAFALRRYLLRVDPLNLTVLFNQAYSLRTLGRLDESIATYRTLLSLNPGRGQTRAQLGVALLLKGDAAGALAEIEQDISDPWRMINLPMAYHALGRKADSDAALAALVEKFPKDDAFNIAYVYAYRGEPDKAFEWLDKAIEYHDAGVSSIAGESLFEPIRSDPRWLPFLRKIGMAPEQLAKIEFEVKLPAEPQAGSSSP